MQGYETDKAKEDGGKAKVVKERIHFNINRLFH
jgi:hypothetical protein